MFINKLLLSYARTGSIRYLRKSAFRKFCRRNKCVRYKIKTLHGFDMNVIIGDSVDNQIFVNRTYEPELSNFFAVLAQKCTSFVDVGCNIGYYSCLFQFVNPACKVFSIDANPKMVIRTEENLKLNIFTNYVTSNVGVSFQTDSLIFNIPKNRHSLSSFAYLPTRGGGGDVQQIEIAVKPLFEIIPRDKISDSVLKIDTEGFEYNVLSGLSSSDAQLFRCIVFELSQQNMLQAGIDMENIFSIPWLSSFSCWSINNNGQLIRFYPDQPITEEVSVVLLNNKTDHSQLLNMNYNSKF